MFSYIQLNLLHLKIKKLWSDKFSEIDKSYINLIFPNFTVKKETAFYKNYNWQKIRKLKLVLDLENASQQKC